MLYIGENLKSLRKNTNLTQDEVAEMLGVSPQSVSKWERGDTYPDITLLPSIANIFKTSVDALIGMDRICDAEARNAIFKKEHALLQQGDHRAASEVLEEALKTFPNDESFMSELALALSFESDTDKLERAITLCQRVLSGNPSEKVRHTTRASMCFLYMKIGDKEKAITSAQNLPHMRESREAVLAQIEKNTTKTEIDRYLKFIALGEENEQDVICIDIGIGMISAAKDYNLLENIHTLRNEFGNDSLPPVRIRDNISLAPKQVRLRHYADLLLDKEFESAEEAANEILTLIREILKKSLK